MTILVSILGLALLMVIHEAGHLLAARAFGMRVIRFSIGFGPALWRHQPRGSDTIYQVALIPFLAYVQIAGMNPLEDIDPRDKGSYANASLIGRVVTIFGGPLANYLFASVLFFASFVFGGRVFRPTEVSVLEGRPAAVANIKDGDVILEIGGVKVAEWDEMADVIAKSPDRELTVVIKRGDEQVTTKVLPTNEGGRGKIGVKLRGEPRRVPVTVGEAAKLSVLMPPTVVRDLVIGIGQYLTGKAEGELAGPAGIVKETARAAKSGWTDLLYFLGALSAYLGAFNLIPFPALDGGRLMFLGYEAATRRRPNARIEAQVHAIGLVMMLGLMAYVTFVNDFRLGFK